MAPRKDHPIAPERLAPEALRDEAWQMISDSLSARAKAEYDRLNERGPSVPAAL